jgi:hypothetical protein
MDFSKAIEKPASFKRYYDVHFADDTVPDIQTRHIYLNSSLKGFIETQNKSFEFAVPVTIRRGSEKFEYAPNSIQELISITNKISTNVYLRTEFSLFKDYLNWFENNQKVTTIRRRVNGIEVPINQTLGMWDTTDDKRVPTLNHPPLFWVDIKKIEYVKFQDLSQVDAKFDGFRDLDELNYAFRNRVYKGIKDSDWLTIYTLLKSK